MVFLKSPFGYKLVTTESNQNNIIFTQAFLVVKMFLNSLQSSKIVKVLRRKKFDAADSVAPVFLNFVGGHLWSSIGTLVNIDNI